MSNHTVVDDLAEQAPAFDWGALFGSIGSFLEFALIVVVSYAVGRVSRRLHHRSLRKAPTTGQLLWGRLMVLIAVTVGVFMALSLVYGVQPLNLFATLGLVSLALGFGLQNTVANLAAGVGLTADKPFDVGDRIKVGETWGDVVTIGLRSTRILTVNGDLVVVPNSILDTRELWNYTYEKHQKFRLDIPVSISYGSSIRLAESLMLEVARGDDRVLAYPDPVVRAMAFGESSVDLQLRLWLARTEQRAIVRDRMIRGIKERFDEAGVHFPFPQVTLSQLKELPEPAPTPAFLEGDAAAKPVVLVCTRSRESATEMAEGVVDFVHRLDARMVVLHVRPPVEAMSPFQAQAALNTYLDAAQRARVPARAISEVGELPQLLRKIVRETGARLVLFGRPQGRWLAAGWVRSEVSEAQAASPVPVVLVDTHGHVDDDEIGRWQEHLHPRPDPDEAPPKEAPEEA